MNGIQAFLTSNKISILIGIALWAGGLASSAFAQTSPENQPIDSMSKDFTELSLEELMDVEVTSVSKKKQKLSESAAAVYVITQEDIRRSGFTSIPEALRLVPGLDVARITANKWAISVRGFNSQFANKLLVLIDGRSVYTPFFAGVFWDVQDTLLEDVDRIEVIRGPGGTLWGANAVNGIINIVTKKAQDSQGGLVTAGGGNLEHGFGGVRYGGKLGEHAAYRIYGKYFNRNHFVLPDGNAANDAWDQGRMGFRTDWELSDDNQVTIQGDAYTGQSDQTVSSTTLTPPGSMNVQDSAKVQGGNFLVRWKHLFSPSSRFALQLYYDRTERKETNFNITRDTFDLDLQHHFNMFDIHDIVWGLGYRLSHDHFKNTFTLSVNPDKFDFEIINGFFQDEISLIPDKLRLTLGTKISYNTFTDFEFQPNSRLLWKPHDNHTLWGAISRAVRLPSRIDRGGRLNVAAFPGFGGPTVVALLGDQNFKSEEVLAYEVGYRTTYIPNVSVDATAFYNVYRRLSSVEAGTPFFETTPPPPHLVLPSTFGNQLNGNSYGVEVATKWRVTPDWNLSANYTWFRLRLRPDASSTDTLSANATGDNPKHQVQFRSTYNLPYNLEFDSSLFYISRLTNLNVSSYTRVDARLGWHPIDSLEISLVGQNLFDKQHPEFSTTSGVGGGSVGGTTLSQVPRSGYAKLTWRF